MFLLLVRGDVQIEGAYRSWADERWGLHAEGSVKPNHHSFDGFVEDGICKASDFQSIGSTGLVVDVASVHTALKVVELAARRSSWGQLVSRNPNQDGIAPVVALKSSLHIASDVRLSTVVLLLGEIDFLEAMQPRESRHT